MAIAQSKLTAQGQISVPADVRKKLGIGPGSTIEWVEEGDNIVVRRSKKYTSQEIHKVLFPDGPPKRVSLKGLKKGIEQYILEKHGRR